MLLVVLVLAIYLIPDLRHRVVTMVIKPHQTIYIPVLWVILALRPSLLQGPQLGVISHWSKCVDWY